MKNDSDKLQQTIIKLDNLLTEGRLRYVSLRQEYSQVKDKEGFNLGNFINGIDDNLNEWFRVVVKVLDTDFTEKYHLFHFVQHQGSSMSLIGYPMDLSNKYIKFEEHLYALEDIILRLEEKRNLAVRQEIAEKEYQADILYKITYSDHTREIKLNNIVLARPQFDSKNANFFEYVYTKPNHPIKVSNIEEYTAMELADNVQDILRDLGFKGNIRKIFFPIASKAKVMFVNPISKQYAIDKDLPVIDLIKPTRQDESQREKPRRKSK